MCNQISITLLCHEGVILLSRRETLKRSGWLAAVPLFSAAGYASNGRAGRKALVVERLPIRAVMPSVDLHLAANAQAIGLLKKIQQGTPDRASLANGAQLMHHYAEHLAHWEVDTKVKKLAKSKIGQSPNAVSQDLVTQAAAQMTQLGLTVKASDLQGTMSPTQEEHDAAMRHLSRHGLSPIYHIFGDLLEAGASWASTAGAEVVSTHAEAAKGWFETALWHPEMDATQHGAQSEAHLLRVQNSCKAPQPPQPPSWCPGPAALGLAHTIFVGAGGIAAFFAGGAVADLSGYELCTEIALEAATTDAATDGLGLLMTPFEVWACANSQAIVEGIQAAFAKFGGAGQAGLGALIGDVLYNYLTDWLKQRNCPV